MVDIYIASIRPEASNEMLPTLLRQPELTSLTLVCNNFNPELIKHKHSKLRLIKGDNAKGCSEKLRYIADGKAKYVATCDDDILYPKTYLADLIEGVKWNDCLVSFHGRILPDLPIHSYYRHRKTVYHCRETVTKDVFVDIIGSGVAMYERRRMLQMQRLYQCVKHPNMTDIYMSWLAKISGVARCVLKHNADYFDFVKGITDTIHSQAVNNCENQTKFINELW